MIEAVVFVLAAAGCILCAKAFSWFRENARKNHADNSAAANSSAQKLPAAESGGRGSAGCCPVCGSRLQPGLQIKSVIYPPAAGSTDQSCRIFGCPYCYPAVQPGVKRRCPVCNETLPPESFLIARMFDRGFQKKHVHVNGCIKCSYGTKM